jgi:hypothetical protein
MAGSDKPLTRFLITLCHSTELLAAFNEYPARVLQEWGLADHPVFRSEGSPTLEEIQRAVAAEHESEGAQVEVAWWIRVFGGPPPRPDWVWGPQDAPEDDGGGGGGGQSAA